MTSPQSPILSSESKSNLRLKVNNFDLLRFVFAFIVFLVHAYALSGAKSLAVITQFLSSEIAVKSFFIVSGFLIFMSYENSHNLKTYFLKRVRRIYPAYLCVILFCAFFGYIFSTSSFDNYFSVDLVKYIFANLFFLNFISPNLPGVFESNQLQAVNGALWTLKIEVMFYLFVPFTVMAFKKFDRLMVIMAIYVGSVVYTFLLLGVAVESGAGIYKELQRQLPGQLAYFMAGAAGYYYYAYLAKYALWAVLFAIFAFMFQSALPWIALEPIMLGVLVVYFACIFPCVGNFGKYGDFSYGIYIVHFPILQVLVSYDLFTSSAWFALVISGILILLTAYLLWHLVEKPFLRQSSHYIAARVG